jgi:hypothetical protein
MIFGTGAVYAVRFTSAITTATSFDLMGVLAPTISSKTAFI